MTRRSFFGGLLAASVLGPKALYDFARRKKKAKVPAWVIRQMADRIMELEASSTYSREWPPPYEPDRKPVGMKYWLYDESVP